MSEKNKTNDLDIEGLLSLKAFEKPSAERVEKCVQNTMRAVREAHAKPSLLHFPDKSYAWMFAQPRYGIAALFILFLGLHLLDRPMPSQEPVGSGVVSATMSADAELAARMALESTNTTATVPGIKRVYSSRLTASAESPIR
jgi:hypothetical protein